ncbi:MAG: hypothetical protein RJB22_86 [Pseudomonadota bacterium]|jgi:hypothetical protein
MSNTAVPIRPIAKGSLIKLWGGIALVTAVAGGLAWVGTAKAVGQSCAASLMLPAGNGVADPETTESGLVIQTRKAGTGASPTDSDIALINYKGTLADGTEFDANQQVPMPVAGSIPGFSEALKKMARGGSYRLCIPAELGYGAQQVGPIPANSVLLFDVDLLDFRSQAEVQMMQQLMQQQQQAAGGAGAGEGAPPPEVR